MSPAIKKKTEKSITADLDKMIIYLQENGNTVEELPILSKGKPGSPWETPVGKYAVAYKEEKHFSSIGKVWMPNSIQFLETSLFTAYCIMRTARLFMKDIRAGA